MCPCDCIYRERETEKEGGREKPELSYLTFGCDVKSCFAQCFLGKNKFNYWFSVAPLTVAFLSSCKVIIHPIYYTGKT